MYPFIFVLWGSNMPIFCWSQVRYFFVVKLIRTAPFRPPLQYRSAPQAICPTLGASRNLEWKRCWGYMFALWSCVNGKFTGNHVLVTPKYRGSYKCSHRLMTNSMGDMKGKSHQNERELSSSQVSLTMGCKDFVISCISSANPWF